MISLVWYPASHCWQPIYKQEDRSLTYLQKKVSKVTFSYVVYINRRIRAILQNNTWKWTDSFLLIYNIVADPVHAILKKQTNKKQCLNYSYKGKTEINSLWFYKPAHPPQIRQNRPGSATLCPGTCAGWGPLRSHWPERLWPGPVYWQRWAMAHPSGSPHRWAQRAPVEEGQHRGVKKTLISTI